MKAGGHITDHFLTSCDTLRGHLVFRRHAPIRESLNYRCVQKSRATHSIWFRFRTLRHYAMQPTDTRACHTCHVAITFEDDAGPGVNSTIAIRRQATWKASASRTTKFWRPTCGKSTRGRERQRERDGDRQRETERESVCVSDACA